MSLFGRIFGGKKDTAQSAPSEDYGGYRIIPEPIKEGQVWRLSARIEKEIDGEVKSHKIIRADTISSHEDVVAASIAKAKQLVDDQGDRMFD